MVHTITRLFSPEPVKVAADQNEPLLWFEHEPSNTSDTRNAQALERIKARRAQANN